MALIISDIAGYVRRRLDGEPSIPTLRLVNWAGLHLFGMHDWQFTVGRSVDLGTVAGRSLIALPGDFNRFIAFEPSGTFTASFLTSHAELLELRTSTVTVQGLSYWAALTYQKDVITGLPAPYLDIYPTPSESASDVFTMYYQAGWVDIEKDTDAVPIPPYLELLFLELVFAIAQAVDENDLASLTSRLEPLHFSPLFLNAIHEDGAKQDELGPMSNGVGATYGVPSGIWPTIVGGPYQV